MSAFVSFGNVPSELPWAAKERATGSPEQQPAPSDGSTRAATRAQQTPRYRGDLQGFHATVSNRNAKLRPEIKACSPKS